MKYPVAAFQDINSQEYTFTLPDLPGCQVKSTSVNEGLDLLREAMIAHIKILAEYGEQIPQAQTIDSHKNKAEFLSCVLWAIIEFDITPYLGKSHKINVTLPELLIKQIDDRVSKSEEHKTRSGFIASACMKLLQR